MDVDKVKMKKVLFRLIEEDKFLEAQKLLEAIVVKDSVESVISEAISER